MSELVVDVPEEPGDDPKPLNHLYLVKVLRDRAKFYRSDEGWGLLDIVIKDRRWAAVDIMSQRFCSMLYDLAASIDLDGVPTSKTIKDVQEWARAMTVNAPQRFVTHRVNSFGSKLVYDMATDDGQFVVFEGGKWTIEHGIYPFMRGSATKPQVLPVPTSRKFVDILRTLVNASNDDVYLLAAWVIGCFKVGGPYPVLALGGMQGSAKSTTSRLIKRLVDPHGFELRDPPGSTPELLAAMKNSFVLAYDNLSYMKGNFADQLCKIATKTAIVTRELYSNGNENGVEATRPIIINGIPSFTERPDLVDRTVYVTLKPISREQRQADDDYWANVEAVFPELLGALYNDVARAHIEAPGFKLESMHRMANFIKWSGSVLGKPFLDAYDHAIQESVESSIEANPLVNAIIELMKAQPEWVGSITELEAAIVGSRPFDGKMWPTGVMAMRSALKRFTPVLASVCISVEKAGRSPGPGPRRTLTRIKRTGEWGHQEFSSGVSIA